MNNTYRALLFFWVSLILAFPTYASSDFGVLKVLITLGVMFYMILLGQHKL